MATILIVDDRSVNREFLVTLLAYGGHRLLQAADGAEALDLAKAERPDLVIADILMPTMDGYELVRQLRADPHIAQTRVIFSTAHYHEQEAKELARDCGVSAVITKPSEPEEVLKAVEAALRLTPVAAPPQTSTDEFDREHLRLLTDKLSQKADDLKVTNDRLSALIDLNLQLASELDLQRLIQRFGRAARLIIGARYSITAILDADGEQFQSLFTRSRTRNERFNIRTTQTLRQPPGSAKQFFLALEVGALERQKLNRARVRPVSVGLDFRVEVRKWLRGLDLNQRPLGYEFSNLAI